MAIDLQQREADVVAGGGSLASELLHFSHAPLYSVNAAAQIAEPDTKPEGLWVSVGPSWLEWCRAESFALDRFEHVTRIVLADDARILRVAGPLELDDFNHEFRGPSRGYPHETDRDIEWARVAERYDGIVIAPYVWERRLSMNHDGEHYNWYYGWDVASGCIWHPRAIASLDCVATPSEPSPFKGPNE